MWINRNPVRIDQRCVHPTLTAADVAGTSPLAGVSPDEAIRDGGPLVALITRRALTLISRHAGHDLVVDVRVQDLAVGEIPQPHGWHSDNVPVLAGTAISDPSAVDPSVEHCAIALSTCDGGLCTTEFLQEPIDVELDCTMPTWNQVEDVIESTPELPTIRVPDGHFAVYTSDSVHRSTAAVESGQRLFFRMVNCSSTPSTYGAA